MHGKKVLHIFVKNIFKKNFPITDQTAFKISKKFSLTFSYMFSE